MRAELAIGKGGGEIRAWVQDNAPHKREAREILQWSAWHNERGPDGDVETLELFASRVGPLSKTCEVVHCDRNR